MARTASCNADEVMISAMCVGAGAPLTATDNGATCGVASNTQSKVRLVCMKK